MTFEAVIADQRLVARIVNTAARCGCTFRSIDARTHAGRGINLKVEFDGAPDALRRLDGQLARLIAIDTEAASSLEYAES